MARKLATLAALAIGAGVTILPNLDVWAAWEVRMTSHTDPTPVSTWHPLMYPEYAAGLLAQGVIAAVGVFLAIAAVRWAWRSFG